MRDFGQLEYVHVSGLCVAQEENQHVPLNFCNSQATKRSLAD